MKYCTLKDGALLPVLGQGSWYLGERKDTREAEGRALRAGIEAGMTLLDTAEMYGEGQLPGTQPQDVYKRQEQAPLHSRRYP